MSATADCATHTLDRLRQLGGFPDRVDSSPRYEPGIAAARCELASDVGSSHGGEGRASRTSRRDSNADDVGEGHGHVDDVAVASRSAGENASALRTR
jgi:hypothetical protein